MNHVAKKGFTLIELMLAMTFIAVLLLAVAMTIIQIGASYNKGLALKEVNQTSRDLAADFRKALSSVEAISLTDDYVTNSAGGRVCLGTYSYIWNTAAALDKRTDSSITWFDADTGLAAANRRAVHFVKVSDSARLYCAKDGTGALSYKTIRKVDDPTSTSYANTGAEELIQDGDHSLNIGTFGITTSTSASDSTTGQQLYTINYTITSGKISTMDATQSACLDPSDLNSDINYCAVEQFSLVIRAGNRV